MNIRNPQEHFDTIVIGGGQAGLAAGYHLAQQGRDFVILDGGARVGDCWRKRWDSLVLFTPAQFNNLPGMDFPAPSGHLPTKDEVADYLEQYAERFRLPVRLRTWVERLERTGDHYVIHTQEGRLAADNVVVATGAYQQQRVPDFAADLNDEIQQIPSSAYRNPDQLPAGDVLVVGAANSGAQIALDIARSDPNRHVWLAGRDVGSMKRTILGKDIFWWLYKTIFKVRAHTWLGRKLREKLVSQGAALLDLTQEDLAAAGIERVDRITGVADGRPQTDDGQVLTVATVIWATGYRPNFGWIDLPIFAEDGFPRHRRGVVSEAPGLYFLGLPFLYRGNSSLIGGVGADAAYIAERVDHRARQRANHSESRIVGQVA